MSTDTFHILSIDFDFFQNVTPETLEHYPDGVDVSTEMSTLIWSLCYANQKKTNQLKKSHLQHQRIKSPAPISKQTSSTGYTCIHCQQPRPHL